MKPILTRDEIEQWRQSKLSVDADAALNTITEAVELLREALNDGDCVADALATVFENTLQVAEWNETRRKLKAFLARYEGKEQEDGK